MNLLTKENLMKFRTIAIYGNIGSGKTALAYKILSVIDDKPVYFMKHPRPELLEPLGYKNLSSLGGFEKLHDCIVYLDEPQLYLNIYQHRKNEVIAKICSLARQRNITLIMSSSDTRCFTRHNEAYFDLWIVKNIDYSTVKNGSRIKMIIQENTLITTDGFNLDENEFLYHAINYPEMRGTGKFTLIKNWNDSLSKPFKFPNTNDDNN